MDTPNAIAIFSRFTTATLCSPRSIPPKYERSRPLARAKSSWEKPLASLKDLIVLPSLTKTGLPACEGDGFAMPHTDFLRDMIPRYMIPK